MTGMQIAAIVVLVLIVLPIPLAWVIGTLFPDGYTKTHTQKIKDFVKKEWSRIILVGGVIALMFVLAPDNALQVTLIGAAILAGRFFAIMRRR